MNNETNNEEIKETEEQEEQKEEIEEIEESEKELEDHEEFTYTIDNNNINNDYNKDLDEKKTYIYIMIGFSILVVIIIILILLVNGSKKGTDNYSQIESKLVAGAKNYYEKYPDKLPTIDGNKESVTAETLIENSYLKPFSEMTKEKTSCTGYVDVYKNGESYAYFPFLNCGTTYKSKKLSEKIIEENTTTTGDGIYNINGEYIFRGEYPNNYLKFNNEMWQIIKINKDGSIKVILTESKMEKVVWDDRYNNDKNGYFGINNFRISRILEKLNEIYDNNTYINEENKKLLVKQDWCIGKISADSTPISQLNVCGDIFNSSYIGLINVEEILQPSLDTSCQNSFDISCTNYNYFNIINTGWTLNANEINSYMVYTSDGGAISNRNASTTSIIRPVININGDVLFESGEGTKEKPYIIEK